MVATKVRKSPTQDAAMRACVDRIVSEAPPLTPALLDKVGNIMNGNHTEPRAASPECEKALRELRDTEEALRRAQVALRDAMAGCRGCGLSKEAHALQKDHGMGYHEFVDLNPDDFISIAEAHKPLIAAAEKALEEARVS